MRQDGFLRVVAVDVAGTRAVTKFRGRVVDLNGPLELRMRHRTILIDVATGAIRAERGEFPGDDLGIRRMAAGAVGPWPVIHVGWGRVPVNHRCPGHGPMTCFAWQGRDEMPGRLAFSHCAVVAAGTGRGDTGVIDPCARKGHGALVTGLARSIRDDVIRGLAGCGPAVMTAGAIRDDSRVVHTGAGERHRALVAGLARRIGDDVICRLAERGDAVVTGRAAGGYARMARFCIGRGRIW